MLRIARSIAAALAATAAFAACHTAKPTTPSPPQVVRADDKAVRTRIAQAEAKRGGGVDELVELANHGDGSPVAQESRELALRALGRMGGERAYTTLLAALKEPSVVIAGADAIGVLASLDDLPSAKTDAITMALVTSAKLELPEPALVAVITALGRAGAANSQLFIANLLTVNDRAGKEAAVMAMARFGRRKIAWTPELRTKLVALVDDKALGYAATYAFAREFEPPKKDALSPALAAEQTKLAALLAKRLGNGHVMLRAVAAQALAKQGLVLGEANSAIVDALRDKDWRVAVEAARALVGDSSDNAGRDFVARALVKRAELLANGGEEDQAVTEMMRLLLPYADRPVVLADYADAVKLGEASAPQTRAWMQCLGADARVRAARGASYDELVRCPLLPHLVAPLIADLVTDKVGPIATRRAQVATMFGADDPRTKAAAIGAMSALWPEIADSDRAALCAQLASAIADKDPIVAGAAIEAVEGVFDAAKALPSTAPLVRGLAAIDAATVKRAAEEQDPELGASAIELVGKRKLADGREACRAQLAGAPLVATAARKCLRGFGETVDEPVEPAAATAPDVPLLIGGDKIIWVMTTTRGDIRIELDPDAAPWAVSSIVALTEKHFYDGLDVHRVVPDFVAQGGDPTQSGSGGPGYALPAEPSANACFVEGGVGTADAGRDSAGSQWFIMHSYAPHLDARYTCVGHVVDGAKAANALLIGDRVHVARIEHSPR